MFEKKKKKPLKKSQKQEQKETKRGDKINKQASHQSIGTITK